MPSLLVGMIKNSVLSLQCALHKSFLSMDSILCLVDSCASAIQLNLVFASDAWNFSVFETTVSRMLAWENALLHGIGAAIGVSSFRLAFLMDVFVILIAWNNRINSLKRLAYSSFGFSIAHYCFSLL